MGFLTIYNTAKRLNESKNFDSYMTLDSYTQEALGTILDNVFSRRIRIQDFNTDYFSKKLYTDHDAASLQASMKKGTSPVKAASSIEDAKMAIARYQWCTENWPDAQDEFLMKAYNLMMTDSFFKPLIDTEIHRLHKKEADEKQFEVDVTFADTGKYAPKERDWEKMIDYLNKKSDPERLAKSCKDANKIIARFIIAKALHWDECADEFKKQALNLRVVTAPELEAYARKYANTNIPEQWQEYIDMLRESDTKGGIARRDEKSDDDLLPTTLVKALDENIEVADYKIVRVNGHSYCKIIRYEKPDIFIDWVLSVSYYPRGYGRRHKVNAYMKFAVYESEQDIRSYKYDIIYADNAYDVPKIINNIVNK